MLSRALSLQREQLIRKTARLFGIQRPRQKVTERITVGLEVLRTRGVLDLDGERVVWRAIEPQCAPPWSQATSGAAPGG